MFCALAKEHNIAFPAWKFIKLESLERYLIGIIFIKIQKDFNKNNATNRSRSPSPVEEVVGRRPTSDS